MINIDFEQILKSKEYDFLRENEHIKDKILFLCVSGSYSYGTNVEGSDIDIRGVILNSQSDLLGLGNFEQYKDSNTDTTLYTLNKFIKLAMECNPNIIEMLFCKENHYFYVSKFGQKLLNNRHLFLSKRAFYSFSGYANAQLNRLENHLVRNNITISEERKQITINRAITNAHNSFISKYKIDENAIKTKVGLLDDEYQILVDLDMKEVPLTKLASMITELNQILRDYNKTLSQRNKKNSELKLSKHMMHLVRLFIMGTEILNTHDVSTYRTNDLKLLMDIRNGNYLDDEGKITKGFEQLVETLENDCKIAYHNSTLQDKVNNEKIEELLIEINQSYLLYKTK